MNDVVKDTSGEQFEPEVEVLMPERYPVVLGMRDSADGKSLEVAIMLDDAAPHPDTAPHMIVACFLRDHWPQIVSAAQVDYQLETSAAALARIQEQDKHLPTSDLPQ